LVFSNACVIVRAFLFDHNLGLSNGNGDAEKATNFWYLKPFHVAILPKI
jgi:Trm5-related predicted tRNA methylase